MRNFLDGMSQTRLLVMVVLSVIGTCLGIVSLATFLYVDYYFTHDPKLAVDSANDIPIVIYIAVAIFLALTVGSTVFARSCYLSIRQIVSRGP